MKRLLVFTMIMLGCGGAKAQNIEGQIVASQYGNWKVPGYAPNTYEPQQEPLVLGSPVPQGARFSPVLGTPPDKSGGYTLAATLLINLRSASANTTIVRVTEFD